MRKKILITRSIDINILNYLKKFDLNFISFIDIKYNDYDIIYKNIYNKNYIDSEFIIASKNVIPFILQKKLNEKFYVIGRNTCNILRNYGYTIKKNFDYFSELYNFLINNQKNKNLIFICGNNRNKILIKKLRLKGYNVREIFLYNVYNNYKLLNTYFDVYVFFNPLSFKSFTYFNNIPKYSYIFAIGKTTLNCIKDIYTDREVFYPEFPNTKLLIEKINKICR